MNQKTDIFRAQTQKCVSDFIKDLGRSMTMSGFIIHNEDKMEMVRHFGYHGVELSSDFGLHMVQVCAPKRSALSLQANPERAVLLPRFIVVFKKNDATQVRLLRLGQDLISELIDDEDFIPLNESICEDLRNAIEQAL